MQHCVAGLIEQQPLRLLVRPKTTSMLWTVLPWLWLLFPITGTLDWRKLAPLAAEQGFRNRSVAVRSGEVQSGYATGVGDAKVALAWWWCTCCYHRCHATTHITTACEQERWTGKKGQTHNRDHTRVQYTNHAAESVCNQYR